MLVATWGFHKIGGTLLGVPILRIIIFWGLYWGPPILGNYHMVESRYVEYIIWNIDLSPKVVLWEPPLGPKYIFYTHRKPYLNALLQVHSPWPRVSVLLLGVGFRK